MSRTNWNNRRRAAVVGICVFAFCLSQSVVAQVVINEVIADNLDVDPADVGGGRPDMVELFNTGNEPISLAATGATDATAFALSDAAEYCEADAWRFPSAGTTVPPGGSILVFCDSNAGQGTCEPHASFRIASDGSEPVSLWGPEGADGVRPLVDQVWLPPLKENHSFGRFPDGAGPAPVPLEETLSVFRVNLPGSTSFGSCANQPGTTCLPSPGSPMAQRSCSGAANGEGGNVVPRVEQEAFSTNNPAAGESVAFTVRVEDDADPTPGNIASVQIRYSVDGQEQPPVDMDFDASQGIISGATTGPTNGGVCGVVADLGNPLRRWSLWTGSIPGLPAGSRVSFDFFVADEQGLLDVDPSVTCPVGVGPCDAVGLPGPGCVPAPGCTETFLTGCPFTECVNRREYLVGYVPPGGLSGVVINEVVAAQTSILRDPSESCLNLPPAAAAICGFEDFIELHNTTDELVDLSGLWLSPSPFRPQDWQFPPDSKILAHEYLIVWTDNDGGKCPRPAERKNGDGQECPDPTDPSRGSYHTDFNLNGSGDQILLFEETQNGFGLVHGLEFGVGLPNFSWSLSPDGDRAGTLQARFGGTAGRPNDGDIGPTFKRGDANGDCALDLVDAIFFLTFQFLGEGPGLSCPDAADSDDTGKLEVTDAIFTLGFLFLGSPLPLPPGPFTAGVDSTPDALGPCMSSDC